ncbi:MAG: SRPBCC domain-containing protein [Rhodomicrobiaceae bacterium]
MTLLHSAPGDDPVVIEEEFDAPVEKVYRAWTDPEEMVKWFGSAPDAANKAEMDLRVGGRWRYVFKRTDDRAEYVEGEYLTVDRNAALAFSWSHVVETADGEREVTPASRVTVNFEATGGKTRVHLRHEAIQRETARRNVGHGWSRSFERLADRLSHSEGKAA